MVVVTPERMRECQRVIRWGWEVIAAEVGVSDRSLRRMAAGQKPIPSEVEDWLLRMAAGILAVPRPAKPLLGKPGRPAKARPEENVPA